jgi:hypothetical protein
MAWARGKQSLAISDRSGQAFPYLEMVKEWTGALVHISEFEHKSPQISPPYHQPDPIALQDPRSQDFQQLTEVSGVLASSGGQGMITADLTLPGQFAFINQGTSSMTPADPSLQNKRRELKIVAASVTVVIS